MATLSVPLLMGLAVAANAALFTITHGLLYRVPDLPDVDRIVHIEAPTHEVARWSPRQIVETQERLANTQLLASRTTVTFTRLIDDRQHPDRSAAIRAVVVDRNFFSMTGTRAQFGGVTMEPYQRGTPRNVVLGYNLWKARFGGDPTVVGRVIDIPGTQELDRWLVAGVMPEGFDFPRGANFWAAGVARPTVFSVPTYATLAEGTSVDAFRHEFPAVLITPLREHLRPAGAASLPLLLTASALLLIAAFIQIAGLVLTRSSARAGQVAVRFALGARTAHLCRQLAGEAGAVILVASAVALLSTVPLTRLVERLLPNEIVAGHNLGLDGSMVLFALLLLGLGFTALTMAPVLALRHVNPAALIRLAPQYGHTGAYRFGSMALFGFQVIVSAAVVYLALMALHGLVRLNRVDLGFDANRLYAVRLPMAPISRGAPADQIRAAYSAYSALLTETSARIRQLPGVTSIAQASHMPVDLIEPARVRVEVERTPGQHIDAFFANISPGYVETIGATWQAGREPELRRVDADVGVALANATLAHLLSEQGPPVGQVVSITPALRFEVTGIVSDIKVRGPEQKPFPALYAYWPHGVAGGPVLLIRLRERSGGTLRQVQSILQASFGDRAPAFIASVEDIAASTTATHRAKVTILGVVALLCLPITALGIAGAASHSCQMRMREIAIRHALGSEPWALRRLLVRKPMTVVLGCTCLGVALGVTLSRVVAAIFHGVEAVDFPASAAAAVIVVGIGYFAAALPARRVTRLGSVTTLREI